MKANLKNLIKLYVNVRGELDQAQVKLFFLQFPQDVHSYKSYRIQNQDNLKRI